MRYNAYDEFLKECGVFYVITENGGKPEARPFGAMLTTSEALYLVTHREKEVYKQMKKHPWVQIMAHKQGTRDWLRIDGVAEEKDDIALRVRIYAENPGLTEHFTAPDDPEMAVIAVHNLTVDWHLEGQPVFNEEEGEEN